MYHNPLGYYSALPWTAGLPKNATRQPYRLHFSVHDKNHAWIQYHPTMEVALMEMKADAVREYPTAHAFWIESTQED